MILVLGQSRKAVLVSKDRAEKMCWFQRTEQKRCAGFKGQSRKDVLVSKDRAGKLCCFQRHGLVVERCSC